MAGKVDYNTLRAQTMGAGQDEEAVTVNTRALIDKVLARYSGEWTVLRELLQNAADAGASKVTVKFETMPSPSVPLPQSPSQSTLLQHAILHHTLKSLVVTNNGQPFGSNDWSRLRRIAEGNPDETKIGAFGVGFYSVFSDCEEPFVSSGKEAMAFYWKENSLFTRRLQLSETQSSSDTTFVLNYRNMTSPVPSILPLAQFLTSSLTFVGLTNIELWLDDWKLLTLNKLVAPGYNLPVPRGLKTTTHENIMKIGSVVHETAQLDAKWLSIVGWKPKIATSANESSSKSAPPTQSLRSFFSKFSSSSGTSAAAAKAAREERAAQELISEDLTAECKMTIFLHVNTASVATSVSKTFGVELERATKKAAPRRTTIAVLTASYQEVDPAEDDKNSPSRLIDIFANVLPSKLGRIYIGFPTHQTTGLAAHVSAPSVIPTVERESIDLNARWVRTWNMEMLRAVGIVTRIAWSGAIELIRDNLTRQMTSAGTSKIRNEDVEKALPQAAHLLNQYTFRESTPSSQVGSLIEESFWTCQANASIEILSSRGILPSQNVRLATDELSFVEGIPVVPQALLQNANGFVKRLIDYGIITDVTTGDIKKELERQALNVKQMIEFLQWLSHKARIHEVDSNVIKSLLDGTIVNDEEDGKVWMLGQIEHFINPSKIPGNMPSPQNTLPFKFTKGIEKGHLENLGWTDLTIVPWMRFLVENTGGRAALTVDHDITASSDFAGQVLPVVSKQWEGLSQSSKASVIDILSSRTTIPTKMGMRKPAQAYFPSVKLFEDLPVVNLSSVKEKFLAALGVRKTIELDIVFQRLLNPEKTEATAAWSHVDLVKYLASVRGDIPKQDVIKLHEAAICTAEGADDKQRYRVSDLYEPNDDLRALGLKIIHWPKIYRAGSDEGRFLRALGIRTYPTVPELINIITAASTASNRLLMDKALRYMVESFHQNGYSALEVSKAPIPFLPLDSGDKLELPVRCFTNEKASMMGFSILRKDLHPHADKLGVKANPPMEDCITWLASNPPETNRDARQVFDYFATRLNELSGKPLDIVSQSNIVPVVSRSGSTSEKGKRTRHVPPTAVFLGSGERYADIFDYVDFGTTANSFLLRCGSKHEPTTVELASLVVREPARIFSTFGSAEKYLEVLFTLARSFSSLKKNKDLVGDMKKSAFLLAYVEYPAENTGNKADAELDEDATVRTYQLVRADQTLIVDDIISYGLFKANILAAPQDEELEAFYANLGARSLSSVVEVTPRVGQTLADQSAATKLKKLVLERIKLFFHDISPDQIKRDASWIEKNLTLVAVTSITVNKTLANTNISHKEIYHAFPNEHPQLGKVIFFVQGAKDYFNFSQALLHVCLHRAKPQSAIILTTLLESPLQILRARGYDVSRILKKKAAEARIAEDNRKKQLEEERQRMEEMEASRRARNSQMGITQDRDTNMPGLFPDSPDRPERAGRELAPPPAPSMNDRPRGLFSALQRTFGTDRHSTSQIPQAPTKPGYFNDVAKPPIKGPDSQISRPDDSSSNLQKNLLNAIGASRAHNSSSVSSDPVENEVRETQTFCDKKPSQNISFFAEGAYGVKIFLQKDMPDKPRFMAANSSAMNSFAGVLITVADALHLTRQSLHVFYDGEESSTIAFNSSCALFFNYRYFEKLHLADVQQGKTSEAVIYWFVTTCHELAHNIVADHSAAHSFYTESFVAQFFTRVAQQIASQAASSAQQQNASALDPPPSYS